ncbi:MAG TPA: hypothetical protein VGM25_09305 [Caulobacteraceae bacterium]|jgi:hypothetical protein
MPDPTPARLPLDHTLDEGLQTLFGGLAAEPVPASLIRLVDRLEAASRRAAALGEGRIIA